MKLTLLCGVFLIASLIPFSLSQTIKTNSYGSPREDWTSGNKNKFYLRPDDTTLYGLLPAEIEYPTVIESYIVDFVRKLDSIIDNCLIFDFANIDPKDFKPEEDEFPLAFQRRLDPFIYLVKFVLAISFVMYFIRQQYGSMGGFKKKVLRLRERNKASVNKLRTITLFIVMLFGICWLLTAVASSVIDDEHIVKFAKDQSKEIKDSVASVKQNMWNINNLKHNNYFTEEDLYWPYFNVADYLEKAYLEENINRDQSNSIVNQIQTFCRWYLIVGIIWWVICLILVAVHKSAYRKRMVAISLVIAFVYILMICLGIVLLGYKASNLSMKTEICVQTLNLTLYDQWPIEGNGISNFVISVNSQRTLNYVKRQLYAQAIASNTAYTVYLDRLAALGRQGDIKDISEENKVKTLMDNFMVKSEDDTTLREQFYLLNDLWSTTMELRSLTRNMDLKHWAYQYSENVCYLGLIIDLVSMMFLLIVIIGLFFAFFMAWSSEYVLRCVIFEEKASIDLNKFRHDWG